MKLKPLILAFSLLLMQNNSSAQPIEIHNGAYMSYSRSRANGEMDLTNLAHSNCFEDLWIYTSGRWYDAGRNEDTETVEQDIYRVESILRTTSGPVYEYHTHPHGCSPYSDTDGISLKAISWFDVLAHAYLSERVERHGRRLYSRAVDEHGIWSYTVTKRLRESILSNDLNAINLLEAKINDGARMLLKIRRRHFDSRLRNYVNFVRNAGVIVGYRRMRQ